MSDTKTAAAPTKTFADFGVEQSICDSLAEVGIISPFPIQEMTLPMALSGADIIGQARTGTGKTLGFGLPLIQRIDVKGGLQALVIVPTRELCLQVTDDLAQAGKGRGVDVLAVYGGKAIQPQIDAIADGAHLVVGTPGRLLDLSRRGVLDLSQCAGLVLDEADEMLDLGFLPDVEALIEQCKDDRQTLLFSATMPAAIVGLARRYMSKPTFMRAEVEEINIAPKTQQYFFSCHRMDKPAVLARILQDPERGLCVVFCRTKRMADILAEELRDRDVAAQAIHSDLRQEAREKVMQKFRDGKVTVLCATEVAARGLDIDDVTHVVNYDCPDDEKMYLHRIGRTGRAGAKGVAVTFAVWNELPRLEMIRRELDITDEIHEVFSTSPLLDELFDLPAREERKKVPSPVPSKSGKKERSKRSDDDRSSRAPRSRRAGNEKSDDEGADAQKSTDRESSGRGSDSRGSDSQGSDSQGSTRSGSGRSGSGRTRSKRSEGDDGAQDTVSTTSDSADEGDDTVRRRTRTRTRSTSAGSRSTARDSRADDTTDDTTDDAPDDNGSDSDSRATRTRDSRGPRGASASRDNGGRDTSGRDTSGRDTSGRDTSGRDNGADSRRSDDDSDSDDQAPRRRRRNRGGKGRSGGGSSTQANRDGDQKTTARSSEPRKDDDGRRSSTGKGGNERNAKSNARSDSRSNTQSNTGGRGRGDDEGRSGNSSRSKSRSNRDNDRRDSSRSRSGGSRETRSRRDVDHTEARGIGKPRLNRKLEVEHLP